MNTWFFSFCISWTTVQLLSCWCKALWTTYVTEQEWTAWKSKWLKPALLWRTQWGLVRALPLSELARVQSLSCCKAKCELLLPLWSLSPSQNIHIFWRLTSLHLLNGAQISSILYLLMGQFYLGWAVIPFRDLTQGVINKGNIYNVGPHGMCPDYNIKMRPETHVGTLVSKERKSRHASQQGGTARSPRTCTLCRTRTDGSTCLWSTLSYTSTADAPQRGQATKWQLKKEGFLVTSNLVPDVATAQLKIPVTAGAAPPGPHRKQLWHCLNLQIRTGRGSGLLDPLQRLLH